MLKANKISWKKGSKTILEDIDFVIHSGECLGVIGPNGSGKSSLLKILALLESPTSGDIWFQGQHISRNATLNMRRKIAIVFQEALLLDTSVWENVAVGLKIRRISSSEIKRRVTYWLEQFGIPHLAKQPSRSLSGGEAQRVSLARAFALEPDIMFLDEPFSALDAPTKEALRTDLAKIFQSTKITTVLVSHDFEDIARLAQRTILLIQGKIVADAPPSKLLSTAQSSDVDQFLTYWRTISELTS